MITDYKVIIQQYDAQGNVIFQRVRYYEGDITTEPEQNTLTEEMEDITRYRRSTLYETVDYTYESA